MKKIFAGLAFIGMLPLVNASNLPSTRKSYLEGTVVKIEKNDSPQMSSGSNPAITTGLP